MSAGSAGKSESGPEHHADLDEAPYPAGRTRRRGGQQLLTQESTAAARSASSSDAWKRALSSPTKPLADISHNSDRGGSRDRFLARHATTAASKAASSPKRSASRPRWHRGSPEC